MEHLSIRYSLAFFSTLICFSLYGNNAVAKINNKQAPEIEIGDSNLNLLLHGLDVDHLEPGNVDYERLTALTNSKAIMEQAYGKFLGFCLYCFPTSSKMDAFIEAVRKSDSWHWIILDRSNSNAMVGEVGLQQISEEEDLELLERPNKKVFSVFGVLAENYQHKRILSRLSTHLIPKIEDFNRSENLEIQSLVIDTRSANIAVTRVAERMGFKALKPHTFNLGRLLPFVQTERMIYIRDLR